MKVIVAGEMPFLQDIGQACVKAGHDTSVFLVEDFFGALESGFLIEKVNDADVVIEIHNESAATKQELLLALDHASPPDTLFMTSAFPCPTAGNERRQLTIPSFLTISAVDIRRDVVFQLQTQL